MTDTDLPGHQGQRSTSQDYQMNGYIEVSLATVYQIKRERTPAL